jgi:metallo-beta-lactamase class B
MRLNSSAMNLVVKTMSLNRNAARLLVPLLLVLTCGSVRAQSNPDWTTPLAPFRIAGNLYYVGSRDLASYLVVTPAGDILINSNLATSPPLIRHSVEQLGFRFSDIKILLISHAHFDHAGGSAAILRQTHAKYMVMDSDVATVESGGRTDFAFGPKPQMAAAHVDRVLHDGDQVRLGGTVLTAHKTPGHTPGCTTWTMVVKDNGKLRNVVIVGSWSVLSEYRLVATRTRPASYPGIAQDFTHTFDVLSSLPCDIFLGAHGIYFDMLAKLARMPAEGSAVWIDPQGYRQAVARNRASFEADLARQQAAATSRRP